MPNMTIDQHARRLQTQVKLYEHMVGVYKRNPSTDYYAAMHRLYKEMENYQKEIKRAISEGETNFFWDTFKLWPIDEEVKLSRGRAGDVDPSGVMTKQQCGRGSRYINGAKCSVSNGEW